MVSASKARAFFGWVANSTAMSRAFRGWVGGGGITPGYPKAMMRNGGTVNFAQLTGSVAWGPKT